MTYDILHHEDVIHITKRVLLPPMQDAVIPPVGSATVERMFTNLVTRALKRRSALGVQHRRHRSTGPLIDFIQQSPRRSEQAQPIRAHDAFRGRLSATGHRSRGVARSPRVVAHRRLRTSSASLKFAVKVVTSARSRPHQVGRTRHDLSTVRNTIILGYVNVGCTSKSACRLHQPESAPELSPGRPRSACPSTATPTRYRRHTRHTANTPRDYWFVTFGLLNVRPRAPDVRVPQGQGHR